MNAEQLQVIKDRYEKATAGPWYSHADGTVFLKHTQAIADVWTDNEEADAAFIAHAREDIPALIAEVEQLQKALEIILEEEGPNCDGYETLIHATARRALEGTK